MFDITQHSLGQGATQRAHAEVTPEAQSVAAKPDAPLNGKHLKEAVVTLSLRSGVLIPLLPEAAPGARRRSARQFLHKQRGSRRKRWKILHEAVASLDDSETRLKA